MLRYAAPGDSNGVLIFKTHIQEWEINIGHLGGHNIWKKRSGALFSQKGRMTYVDQVLRPLAVPFYEECLREIGEMIYMDDGAAYHTFKYTKKVLR